MKATIRRLLVIAFALVGCCAVISGQAQAAGNGRYAAIVIDAQTGNVLHADNADDLRYPASLTKMMTLYLTFEALDDGRLNLEQRLPVSAWAQSMSPTKLGLTEGNTVRVEHAVLGLVTKSANDAAVVLAEALGGSESRFAEIMTRKARSLGMTSTTFQNASGLPDAGQVTTARDFAKLGMALVRDHPKYYHYFSRRDFAYGGRKLPNHNRLMSRYEGMDGIKTGYIGASGFNLVGSAVRDGRRLVAVVMGGKSPLLRDNRMAELLDESFEKIGVARRSSTGTGLVAEAERNPVIAPVYAAHKERQMAARHRHDKIGKTTASAVKAAPRPTKAGKWSVQIGAFTSRKAGEEALAAAGKKAGGWLASASGVVSSTKTSKGTVYRARFVGLDEKNAKSACAALSKAGKACSPVSPQG
jgi:D-alanyl-D-alanine carboxypeptidase